MNQSTCGYQGHYCSNGVQFISRYRDMIDFCVAGVRITLYDDGHIHSTCHDVTDAEKRAILLHLLQEYADYCAWHVEQKDKSPGERGLWHLLPFHHEARELLPAIRTVRVEVPA